MNTMNLGGAWEFRQRDTGSWMPFSLTTISR